MNPWWIGALVVGGLMWWGIIVGAEAGYNAYETNQACHTQLEPTDHYQRLQ